MRLQLRSVVPASAHSQRYFEAVCDLARSGRGRSGRCGRRGSRGGSRAGRTALHLGVGGGAGHASHAVNDFRKLCLIESYAPTDNVSELTARTNDDGWDTSFIDWLGVSKLSARDALLVFSVGGGSREHNVSVNLVNAIERAREVGAAIYGVVGSPGGTLAQLADVAVIITAPGDLRTPLVESFQAVVWHALVSHPQLAARQGHWESLGAGRRDLRRAAFIDRDGTINELVPDPVDGLPGGPLRRARRRADPGSCRGAAPTVRRGWLLVGVSNQPAAAKGKASLEELAEVQARVLELLAAEGVRFDDFRLCMHHPDGVVPELTGDCDCRKAGAGNAARGRGAARASTSRRRG